MSKDNLKQTAEKLFASGAYKVLFGIESSGEFFTQESLAKQACKKDENPVKFENGKPVKIETAGQTSNDKPVYPFNSKTTIAKIKATKTLEELKAFELETEKREGVLKEIELQKEKLIAELDVNQSGTKAE